jgi:hypothetical protein
MKSKETKYCCYRFKESVLSGKICRTEDMPDETEWYFPEWFHLYFCPFCGTRIKGDGSGTFDTKSEKYAR